MEFGTKQDSNRGPKISKPESAGKKFLLPIVLLERKSFQLNSP